MDFRNTKIKILSKEHGEAFQKAVFEAGGSWASITRGIINDTTDRLLFVSKDLKITWVGKSDTTYFKQHKNKEITFPETRKGHPHHELMVMYAEDAKENPEPWKLWEREAAGGHFIPCERSPRWETYSAYRRKPKTKIIHGVEVPDISFLPTHGQPYHYTEILTPELYDSEIYYDGSEFNNHVCSHGLCYPYTEEGRQAAILHAKAMLGVVF